MVSVWLHGTDFIIFITLMSQNAWFLIIKCWVNSDINEQHCTLLLGKPWGLGANASDIKIKHEKLKLIEYEGSWVDMEIAKAYRQEDCTCMLLLLNIKGKDTENTLYYLARFWTLQDSGVQRAKLNKGKKLSKAWMDCELPFMYRTVENIFMFIYFFKWLHTDV